MCWPARGDALDPQFKKLARGRARARTMIMIDSWPNYSGKRSVPLKIRVGYPGRFLLTASRYPCQRAFYRTVLVFVLFFFVKFRSPRLPLIACAPFLVCVFTFKFHEATWRNFKIWIRHFALENLKFYYECLSFFKFKYLVFIDQIYLSLKRYHAIQRFHKI